MTDSTIFSFCEPVTAYTMGREHIREVGPEGIKPGGGVPNQALCGFDVRRGWDLPGLAVTAQNVTRLTTPREGDGHVFVCPACADAWARQQQ